MKGLEEGDIRDYRIVAFDDNFNSSVPVQVIFRMPAVKTVIGVQSLEKKTVAYGTKFKELELPATVKIELDGNMTAEVKVQWNKEDYKADRAGVNVINGELKLEDDMQNPAELAAVIEVEVLAKDAEVTPEPGETPDGTVTPDQDKAPENGSASDKETTKTPENTDKSQTAKADTKKAQSTSPKTGDVTTVGLWLALAVLSGLALITVRTVRRVRRK